MKTPRVSQIVVFLFSLILSSIGCAKPPECEEPFDVRGSEIVCIFKNSNGNYLYRQIRPLYEIDSLKIFDELGNRYTPIATLKSAPDSVMVGVNFISFTPIYNSRTDEDAFEKEICKDFIISYYHNVNDTITTCYKAEKTKCGSKFTNLKVYHEGSLLSEVSNTIIATVTVVNK